MNRLTGRVYKESESATGAWNHTVLSHMLRYEQYRVATFVAATTPSLTYDLEAGDLAHMSLAGEPVRFRYWPEQAPARCVGGDILSA